MSMDCLMIGMGEYPSSPLGLRMYVGEDGGRAKYALADVKIFVEVMMISSLMG